MPAYQARALVLRKTKLGEADTIVTMLSAEGVQIRAVAKGVRKTRSKFGSRLEPFAVSDLLLHRGRNLDIVTEARSVDPHEQVRSDFDRAAAAAVVADMLDKATGDAEPEPLLFELGVATLDAMETAEPAGLLALVAAFLIKAISMLGFRPSIARCARCGGEAGSEAAFSHDSGGTLCPACAGVDPAAERVSPAARDAMRALLAARMSEVGGVPFAGAARDECFRLLRTFVAHHLPARLRSLEFLAEQTAAGAWPSVDSAGG